MNVYLSGSAISTSNISFNQTFQVKFYKYNQEGNLAYEYNPLHNGHIYHIKKIKES